jgi:hypothetical protein
MTKDTDNFDNINFIKYLNRKVLIEAEEAMTLDLPGDDKIPPTPVRADDEHAQPFVESPEEQRKDAENQVKKKNILKRRNRMYGKNPLLWAFEKITDIELKILKNRTPVAIPDAPEPMDEKDIALVQEFLNKQQD